MYGDVWWFHALCGWSNAQEPLELCDQPGGSRHPVEWRRIRKVKTKGWFVPNQSIKTKLAAFTGGEVCHCISFIILFHNHGTSLYIYVCFVCLWVRPVSPIFGKSSNWSFNIKLNQTNQPCLLILIRRLWVFVSPSLLRWFRLWEQLVRAAQIILLHGIVNASAKFILTPRQDATNCNKMPRHPASNNVVART